MATNNIGKNENECDLIHTLNGQRLATVRNLDLTSARPWTQADRNRYPQATRQLLPGETPVRLGRLLYFVTT